MGGKLGLWFWMKGIYLNGVENWMLKEINRCKRDEVMREWMKIV
jgi:myosin-crossreactive antigen